MKRLLLSALVLLTASCGSPTSIQTDVTGTWKTQLGELVILVDLTESGSNLSGNVTFTDSSGDRSGTVTGTVSGANVDFTLSASGGGSVAVSGVLQNETKLSARATSTNFTPAIDDEVALFIKQ